MAVIGMNDICSLDNDKCQVIVVPFYAVTESKLVLYIIHNMYTIDIHVIALLQIHKLL